MQTRIAVIVTLALVGVVAAVIAVRLARAVARHLPGISTPSRDFAASWPAVRRARPSCSRPGHRLSIDEDAHVPIARLPAGRRSSAIGGTHR